MIEIRGEQIDVFRRNSDQVRLHNFAEFIRNQHGDRIVRLPTRETTVKGLGDRLESLVESSIELAKKYGLQQEGNWLAFAVLRFVAAPNFHHHTAINTILHNSGLLAESKIDALWRYSTEEHWDEISKQYNPQAWESDRVVEKRA